MGINYRERTNYHETMRTIAYEWHGGGGSPLYSWASCGGRIIAPTTKEAILSEIDECLSWNGQNGSTSEAVRLTALRTYIAQTTD